MPETDVDEREGFGRPGEQPGQEPGVARPGLPGQPGTMDETEPTDETARGEDTFGQPDENEPGAQPSAPPATTPQEDTRAMGDQPGMDQPGMDQPGMDQPGMDQPGMDQPGMDQPGQMGQTTKTKLETIEQDLAQLDQKLEGEPAAEPGETKQQKDTRQIKAKHKELKNALQRVSRALEDLEKEVERQHRG